ncbi:MAG: PVC-type heme-binding CxxCH protein, partial [Bythopirellula sp.]
LARLEAGEMLPRVLPYEVASWSFGEDLSMVFLAGEVVVDYAIRLQDEFDGARLWLHAYANDAPCYIPSRRVWREGGYEASDAMVYYDQPTRLTAEVEELIVDTVQRLLPHEYYSPAVARDFPPGRSPQESLRSIRVPTGLRVELAAAEPLVVDPVAFDWGPDGRLWVVEMRDYPNGANLVNDANDANGENGENRANGANQARGANPPQDHDAKTGGGRIVWLEDTDGDGSFDQSQVFVDDLPYPTGVKAWRDGVLVTAAPDILQFNDSDGDGKADVRKVLYSGFGEGNQQHRVNGLRWGLDNWLYVGNGDSNGKIRSTASGEVVDVSGRDLRIRPDSGQLEAIAGPTQFGRSMNDWGDWFGGNNSNPLWHYALSDAYLRRNPHVTAPSMRKDVPQAPGAARVYPASRTLERFNDLHAANRFTSACSPILYRDRLLGSKYAGNSFVCEPVHNLVHREIVSASGATFTSRRAEDESESEFLASDDNWFRPVMIRTGPDGALWLADMYRYVIEHPEWIPKDFLRKMDVAAGGDRGRIYRVLPQGQAPRKLPRLDVLTTKQLVEALDSPNGWQRDMVQQLLLWREDPDCRPWLEAMAIKHGNPLARLHALCTLDGLEMLSAPILRTCLQDEQAEVRRHAIRLSEPLLDEDPALLDAVLDRLDDEIPVQKQLAYALGETASPQAGPVLAELLLRHQDDPYLATPAFSSMRSENVAAVFNQFVNAPTSTQPSVALLRELARQSLLLTPEHAKSMLLDYLQANDRALDVRLAIGAELMPSLGDKEASVCGDLVLNARSQINDPDAKLISRQLAVELLGQRLTADSELAKELGELVSPREPASIQQAAVRALARLPDEHAVADRLLSAWAQAAPVVRAEILDVMLSNIERTHLLLARLSQAAGPAIHLGAADRERLLHHS